MMSIGNVFSHRVTRLVIAGVLSSALAACGSDPEPASGQNSGAGGTAGTSSAGGGASGSAGTSTSGGNAGSSGSGGGVAAGGGGSGGSAAGAGGGGSGGTGGTAGGAGTAGSGGGAQNPTAVATIAGLNGVEVTGTATFTQEGDSVNLVLELTACPDGTHASHLHQNKDCGNNGEAAGGHWTPNGEGLGNYECSGGAVTYMVSKPTTTWTVGDDGPNDVTKYSFMVHEAGEPSPGGRIGCGLIEEQ